MTSSMLRASVTLQPNGDPQAGDEVLLLVDGSDTPITANGLSGYTPNPGDRLLVARVGNQLEVVQFLSRGTVPFLSAEDLADLQAQIDLAVEDIEETTNYAHATGDSFTTYVQTNDEALQFLQNSFDSLESVGVTGIDIDYFWVGDAPNVVVQVPISQFVQDAVGAPTYQQFTDAIHVWDKDQIGDIEGWTTDTQGTPPMSTFYDVFVANGRLAQVF